jgi:transcriptional regulator with XRE-family HTH domain
MDAAAVAVITPERDARSPRARANVFRIVRLERGFSIEEVAAQSGISPRRQRQMELARSVRPGTERRFWRAIAELELERENFAREMKDRRRVPTRPAVEAAVHVRPSS